MIDPPKRIEKFIQEMLLNKRKRNVDKKFNHW